MIPLFREFPALKDKIPHIPLGDFPTPIQKLDKIGGKLGISELYVKRDDLTSKIYGGNKVRKLEFILADAVKLGAKTTITFGYAGSNHATATAIYAHLLGMNSISLLLPQPNAYYVRNNLLTSFYFGAKLRQYHNLESAKFGAISYFLLNALAEGKFSYIIPPGGSCSIGNLGFVNAALELREQIEKGEMPVPDYIYLAMGTMGTAVGLTLGLKLANLKTRVVPVRVVGERFASVKKFQRLFYKTGSFLASKDPSFPRIKLSPKDFQFRENFMGKMYALFTREGAKAIELMRRDAGIKLDGSYTGKAFAALMADALDKGLCSSTGKAKLTDKVVLFWNTYNSRDLSPFTSRVDYRQLPWKFYRYFEEDVQEWDKHSPY